MLKIRYVLIVLVMLLCPVTSNSAQVNIRFNISVFPELSVVSGYPVYYAPYLDANYFFYDGLYWLYYDDEWYTSSWYNGPWWIVHPDDVPVYILRIPVRYYRHPPFYFYGWYLDSPPRWHDHWGHEWHQHRRGWDRWDRRSVPPPAPPPVYQRQYSGDRYPRQVEQQHEIHQKNYRYQPHDPVVRQRYQEQIAPRLPEQDRQRGPDGQRGPDDRGVRQQDNQRFESPQRRDEDMRRSAPSVPQQGRPEVQDQRRQQQPNADQRSDQRSDQRGRQIRIEPAQQAAPGQRDIPAATRSQSPQTGGMNIERSTTPPSQEGRREGQDRKQQSQQGLDKREQPQIRSQESPREQTREQPTEQPRAQQRDRGDGNGQQREQEQGRGLDRQNDRRDDRRGDPRDDNRWNN